MQNKKNGKKREAQKEILLDEFLKNEDGVFDDEDEDSVTDDTLEFLSLDDDMIESYQREHQKKTAPARRKRLFRKQKEVYSSDDYEDEDYEDDYEEEKAGYEDDYEEEETGYKDDYEDEDTRYEDDDYEDEDAGYGDDGYEGEDAGYEDDDYEDEDAGYGDDGYEGEDAGYEDGDYEDEETGYEDGDYEDDDARYEEDEDDEEDRYEDVEDDEDDDYDDFDDEYEDDDYDDEDEDEYDDDDGVIVRLRRFLTEMSAMDMVVAMLGIVVLAGVIVTGGLYVNAKAVEKQVEAFASVGEEVQGISVIGESGLLAVAESAKLSNMINLEETFEEGQEEQPEETQDKTIEVMLNLTSIQSDLKIKFVNKATGKLIGGVPFEVEVTGGKTTQNYQDDDRDGIIYKTEIPAGTYSVTVRPLQGDAYQNYRLPASASSVKVTDTIAYKKVDVADEVKTEAEVNVAAEDTAVQDTVVESTLKDTVEWVESTRTEVDGAAVNYEQVPKTSIADPWTSGGAYRKMVEAGARSEGTPDTGDGNTDASNTDTSDGGATTPDGGGTDPNAPTTSTDTTTSSDTTTSTDTTTSNDTTSTGTTPGDATSAGTTSGGTTPGGSGSGGSTSGEPAAALAVTLNHKSLSLKKGDTPVTLDPIVTGAGKDSVSWHSSNESVATVSGGIVTAAGAGTATITASVTAGGRSASDSCTVTVTEDPKTETKVQISLSASTLSLKKGESKLLTATVEPAGSAVAWSSDKASVATVKDGTVTAVAEGTAVITASVAVNGASYSASCTVTVQNADRKVTVSGPTAVAIGKTITLTAQTEPKDAKVVWGSANEKIARVDAKGVVTGVAEGSTDIIVHLEGDSNIYASCRVTVKKDLNGTALLKDKDGNQMYYKDSQGAYHEATFDDYKTQSVFYKKTTTYKYTGWQTIDGYVYFFDKNGNYVTGEQVIQGAKYNFGSDGKMSSGSGTMGIDVSKWNGSIDWNAVKNSGVSYVIIRCGYRGSSTGALIEDPLFRSNIKGAKAAGLKVGAYFFSQAVNEVEAVEEASMAVNLVSGYGLNYPLFLDVESSGGRGDGVSRDMRTAVCKAFCATVQNSGYSAGIYANKTWFNEKINTASLTGYKIWLAQYASAPTYSATRYDMWQYSSKGKVSGISGNVDMNISYMSY